MRKLTFSALVLLCGLACVETYFHAVGVDQAPLLQWDADAQMLIHQPQQTGWRYPDGIPVRYTINAQGWNAPADYPARDYRTHVAAVIGDSFVEALQVDPTESLSARLAAGLGPSSWRVYNFGMSGAPLSEYLHTAHVVTERYHPEIIIVVLSHNDFGESYHPPSNALYRSFWTVEGSGAWTRAPVPYLPSLSAAGMASPVATWRTAVQIGRWFASPTTDTWHMGIDVAQMDDATTASVTDWLFADFTNVRDQSHGSFLFVMDAPRDQLEHGMDPTASVVYPLNRLAQQTAQHYGFPFIDLTPVFQADFQEHGHTFSFRRDYHWNNYAHNLVAQTILPSVQHVP